MKINNHYSMKNDTRPTADQLREAVPAIFAESPAENVSARYGFVSTRKIIDILNEDGYHVAQARGGLRQGSRAYGIHEVRLRKTDRPFALNELFPEIVLLNSHNGTSSAILHMGLYRKVCSNGLVIGDAFETFRVSHIGDPRETVIAAAGRLMESAPLLIDTIKNWRGRNMSTSEIEEFGRRASVLRKLPSGAFIASPNGHGTVTAIRRQEDASDNLWNVFNRTQENLIGGGVNVATPAGRVRRTRALRAVKPLIELNRGLWNLAEEFFLPA